MKLFRKINEWSINESLNHPLRAKIISLFTFSLVLGGYIWGAFYKLPSIQNKLAEHFKGHDDQVKFLLSITVNAFDGMMVMFLIFGSSVSIVMYLWIDGYRTAYSMGIESSRKRIYDGSTQQVDSAEPSTNAVPPSLPSGSAR